MENVRIARAAQALLLLCLTFAVQYVSTGSWTLEVQLHNYTNLYGAYYNFTEKPPCCCLSSRTECNKDIDVLKCGLDIILLHLHVPSCYSVVFTFCVEEECYVYRQSQVFESRPTVNFSESSSNGFTLYPTLWHQGTASNETIDLVIIVTDSTYHHEDRLIDNYTIPLNLVTEITFSNPIEMRGLFNITSFALAYRFFCNKNYYGDQCTVFCKESYSESEGFYNCSSEGVKICIKGYTNPENDCKDKASPVTTYYGTSSMSTCNTAPETVTTVSTKFVKTVSLAPTHCNTSLLNSCSTSIETVSKFKTEAVSPAQTRYDSSSLSTCSTGRETIISVLTKLVTTVSPVTRTSVLNMCSTEEIERISVVTQQVSQGHTNCSPVESGLATVLVLLILTYLIIFLLIALRMVKWIKSRGKYFLTEDATASGITNLNYHVGRKENTRSNEINESTPQPYEVPTEELYAPLINTALSASAHYDNVDHSSGMYASIED